MYLQRYNYEEKIFFSTITYAERIHIGLLIVYIRIRMKFAPLFTVYSAAHWYTRSTTMVKHDCMRYRIPNITGRIVFNCIPIRMRHTFFCASVNATVTLYQIKCMLSNGLRQNILLYLNLSRSNETN